MSLIGDTQLEIKNTDTGLCIICKDGIHNPGGSIKIRRYFSLIDQAKKKFLQPEEQLLKPTGNARMGLALVGILKGYRVPAVIPDKMSLEKLLISRRLGQSYFTRSDVGKDRRYYLM